MPTSISRVRCPRIVRCSRVSMVAERRMMRPCQLQITPCFGPMDGASTIVAHARSPDRRPVTTSVDASALAYGVAHE
jgi:hypothetical protein